MRDMRYVVMHQAGPKWAPGVPMFEQQGLQAHVDHYRTWLDGGKLAQGGPILDSSAAVGMMIPVAGLPRDEVEVHAAADPAVQSGLLTFEIRTWMVGMQKSER